MNKLIDNNQDLNMIKTIKYLLSNKSKILTLSIIFPILYSLFIYIYPTETKITFSITHPSDKSSLDIIEKKASINIFNEFISNISTKANAVGYINKNLIKVENSHIYDLLDNINIKNVDSEEYSRNVIDVSYKFNDGDEHNYKKILFELIELSFYDTVKKIKISSYHDIDINVLKLDELKNNIKKRRDNKIIVLQDKIILDRLKFNLNKKKFLSELDKALKYAELSNIEMPIITGVSNGTIPLFDKNYNLKDHNNISPLFMLGSKILQYEIDFHKSSDNTFENSVTYLDIKAELDFIKNKKLENIDHSEYKSAMHQINESDNATITLINELDKLLDKSFIDGEIYDYEFVKSVEKKYFNKMFAFAFLLFGIFISSGVLVLRKMINELALDD